MNLFGKAKTSNASSGAGGKNPSETIIKLRGTLETLEKRETHMDKKAQFQVDEAKAKLAKKDKKGAMFCLKRKKMYEAEIIKIQGARMTLETQINSLESASINMETFNAMQAGARAMKGVHNTMNIDKVDDTMEDIQEQMAVSEEISAAISAPVGGEMFDDDELLEELNTLAEDDLEEQLLKPARAAPAAAAPVAPAPAFVLPEAPTGAVEVQGGASEDELNALRELEASMAM